MRQWNIGGIYFTGKLSVRRKDCPPGTLDTPKFKWISSWDSFLPGLYGGDSGTNSLNYGTEGIDITT
jgi:hypothetical protein